MKTAGTENNTACGVKIFKLLIAACFALYTSMMCAKSVFNAELVSFIAAMHTDKFNASLANTYYYVTYAATQVALAFIMNKLNVRLYLIVTVPIAAVCGILVAFCANMTEVWILFALQGVFQAGIYAGCMYMLGVYLPPDMLSSGNAILQAGFAIGNTVAYAVSALCVAAGSWRMPYVIFGAVFIISVLFFAVVTARIKRLYPDAEKRLRAGASENKENIDESDSFYNRGLFTLVTKKRVFSFYFWSVVYSLLATTLYYGVNNWVGNFLKEVYGFPDSVSIIISLVVPIMMFFGPAVAISASKKQKNFVKVGLITSAVPLAVSVLLVFVYGLNVVVAVLLIAAFIVSTRTLTGLQSVATFNMRTQINTGAYTAIINAAASISAGVAPTVIGKMIDSANASSLNGNGGWLVMFINATALSVITIAFLAIAYFMTKNKTNYDNKKMKKV